MDQNHARLHTGCGRAMGETDSHCAVLRLTDKNTYGLWAVDGRDMVSTSFCNYRARSRTSYGWAMGETQ